LIASVVEDCAREDVLLAIEILTYALPDESPADFKARVPELIVQAATMARQCGAQMMKLQFPGSREACAAVTEALGDIPWAVLSGGVDHATFLENLRSALQGGASGAIAGRSLWKDCLFGDRAQTARHLRDIAVPRLREVEAILSEVHAA
jgi:tagatose 1,6-diphosphate aldolase